MKKTFITGLSKKITEGKTAKTNAETKTVKKNAAGKAVKRIAAGTMAFALTVSGMGFASPAARAYASDYVFGGDIEFGKEYSHGVGEYTYGLTLEKSGKLTVMFTPSFGLDGFDIFDSYGNNVVREFTTDYNKQITVSCNLLAGEYNFRTNNSGRSYSFITAFSDAKETFNESYDEKNNEQSLATEVKASFKADAQFAANDKTDYYTFDVKKGGNYQISLKSNVQEMSLRLYNEDLTYSNEIKSISGGTHKYNLAIPAGTYYLVAKDTKNDSYGFGGGTYRLETKFTEVAATKVKSVSSPVKQQVKLVAADKKGVAGYQFQLATDKNFKKGKKLITAEKTNTASADKLASGKNYYVRVRSYVVSENGEKIFSKWSSSKTVKVK